MTENTILLLLTTASIGFFHTLLGPDHYLPFIAMSKSGRWSLRKTILVTTMCGIGHVFSSVLLGILVVSIGYVATNLEFIESMRAQIAGWALITFGFVYMVWGIRKSIKNKPHKHWHPHSNGSFHEHKHTHSGHHAHVHSEKSGNHITPWILFLIFILGPCEPLIPLFVYPALKGDLITLYMVIAVFTLVTLSTMLLLVLVSVYGINFLSLKKAERYMHALAGAIILLCGAAIQFLGL
jgi:sulfite exporter TauE/SafE